SRYEPGQEDCHHRWERCGLRAVAKFQPSCALPNTQSWNHRVSVRAWASRTTSAPRCEASKHFLAHSRIVLPYGGLQNTRCCFQSCLSPSCSFVKKVGHVVFFADAHGSSVNLNSACSFSKKERGVGHSSVRLL